MASAWGRLNRSFVPFRRPPSAERWGCPREGGTDRSDTLIRPNRRFRFDDRDRGNRDERPPGGRDVSADVPPEETEAFERTCEAVVERILAGEVDADMSEGTSDRVHLGHLLAELGRSTA